MHKTAARIQSSRETYLSELLDLLRIPSISADSAYKQDVVRAAEKVADFLKKAGADNVEICPTPG